MRSELVSDSLEVVEKEEVKKRTPFEVCSFLGLLRSFAVFCGLLRFFDVFCGLLRSFAVMRSRSRPLGLTAVVDFIASAGPFSKDCRGGMEAFFCCAVWSNPHSEFACGLRSQLLGGPKVGGLLGFSCLSL